MAIAVGACGATTTDASRDPAGAGGSAGTSSGTGATFTSGGTGGTGSSGTSGGTSSGTSSLTGSVFSMNDGGSGDPDKCGEYHFNLERKPAELLLVLDRSASMKKDVNDKDGTPSKWDLVIPSLKEVITSTDSAVSWGMKVFPEGSGSACVATGVTSNIDVPVAASNAVKVNAAITATTDEGNGTPTGDAITQGLKYLQSLKDMNPKYMLLATDGDPSCPSGDAALTYAKSSVSAAATAGIHTFVVGIATSQKSATAALNDMAIAGLEPRDDPNPLSTKYYFANTKEQLVTALKVITGQVSGCTFNWNDPPPVPSNIAVKVGGKKAPHDATDGWEYTGPDNKGVEVRGSWCDSIKTSAANMVEIIFGCPGVDIN